MSSSVLTTIACVALTSIAWGCGGSADAGIPLPVGDTRDASPPDASAPIDASVPDVITPASDAATPPVPDAATPHVPDAAPPLDPSDGKPTPLPCTTGLGSALGKGFGRLDGYVASTQCG